MVTTFTPYTAAIGGVLIGLASAALLYLNGRIAGISGIFDGAIARKAGDASWRWAFLGGMLLGGAAYYWFFGTHGALSLPRSVPVVAAGGLFVGFGTKMANGCTSGHGVCGNARLSPRSIVATLVFVGVGAATVAVMGGAA